MKTINSASGKFRADVTYVDIHKNENLANVARKFFVTFTENTDLS